MAQYLANKPGPKPGFKRGSPSQETVEARKKALQPEERARRATLAQSIAQAKQARIEARRAATAQAAAARQQAHRDKANARLQAKLEKQVKSGRYSSSQDALDAHQATLERLAVKAEFDSLPLDERLELLKQDAEFARERAVYVTGQLKSSESLLAPDSDKEEVEKVVYLRALAEEARLSARYKRAKYAKALNESKPKTPPISGS